MGCGFVLPQVTQVTQSLKPSHPSHAVTKSRRHAVPLSADQLFKITVTLNIHLTDFVPLHIFRQCILYHIIRELGTTFAAVVFQGEKTK